jgi:site-specific DNA-methyltransferase (adenine-specific)
VTPYYADEWVTIYHGDCREIDAWLAADVLVTDPPYGIDWRRGPNTNAYSKAHAGIIGDEDTSVRDHALRLWGSKPAAVFGSFYAPFPQDVRQVLVWAKPADAGVVGSVTGWRRDAEPVFLCGDWPVRKVERSSVLRSHQRSIKSVTVETGHPHTKPRDILRGLITAGPDGVVADPFAGSGSTLRAAKDLGRHAIGIEIEERYCEIAAKRMAQEVLPLVAP